MKTKKTKTFIFASYECAAIQEYLEEMAKKGWMLLSINGYKFKFTKMEPKNLKYSVEVIPKSSELDSPNSQIALEYRDYCESAGWKYVCGKGTIQVFYTEDDCEAISIHTDEKEKFNLVFKSSLSEAILKLFMIALFCLNIHTLTSGGISYFLSSNLAIFGFVANVIIIIITLTEIISFISWAIKSKRRVNEGLNMTYNSLDKLKRKNHIRRLINIIVICTITLVFITDKHQSSNNFAGIFLAIITFLSIFIFDKIIREFFNNSNCSRLIKITIIFVSIIIFTFISMFVILNLLMNSPYVNENTDAKSKYALTLEDFGLVQAKDDEIYEDINTSILSKTSFYILDSEDEESLNYTLLESNYQFVIDLTEKYTIKHDNKFYASHYAEDKFTQNYMIDDIKIHPSQETHAYIIVSNNKVLQIQNNFNNISDDEFLNIIIETLFK